jgi:hypothetical protein
MTHITKEGLLQAIEESLCVYNGEKAWGRSPAWVFDRAAELSAQESKPVDSERVAQLIAHRACCGSEHDPANGKLHGCCVVCGVPWPCSYAGVPPSVSAQGASPKDGWQPAAGTVTGYLSRQKAVEVVLDELPEWAMIPKNRVFLSAKNTCDAIGLLDHGHNADWCAGWNAHLLTTAAPEPPKDVSNAQSK